MQIVLLLTFGLPICVADFNRHIIPNRTLLAFAASIGALLIFKHTFMGHVEFAIKTLLCVAIFQWITAGVMGLGDAKYLVLLALLVGNSSLFSRGLFFSMLAAGVISLIYFIIGRSISIDIPMAPAFTLGFSLAFVL
jgi:Flp pilus assembly protein protease CpaA